VQASERTSLPVSTDCSMAAMPLPAERREPPGINIRRIRSSQEDSCARKVDCRHASTQLFSCFALSWPSCVNRSTVWSSLMAPLSRALADNRCFRGVLSCCLVVTPACRVTIRAVRFWRAPKSGILLAPVGQKINCQRVSYHVGLQRNRNPAGKQQQALLPHA